MYLCSQRFDLGNSCRQAVNSDLADDGVGDPVLNPSIIRERADALGNLL